MILLQKVGDQSNCSADQAANLLLELDPEQEDGHPENDSNSGADDGDEDLAEAREHYVDVG